MNRRFSLPCLILAALRLCQPAFADDRATCEKLLQRVVGNNPKYSGTPAITETLDAIDYARKTGITFTSPEALMANDEITNRLIAAYVQAHESYYPDPLANYADFDVVRVFSDQQVLNDYQSYVSASNPASPAKQFGSYGERIVQVEDITLVNNLPVDGRPAHAYNVKISVDERSMMGPRSYDALIQLALSYEELGLSDRDACLNPVGMHVFSYDNSGGR